MAAQPNVAGMARLLYVVAGVGLVGWGLWSVAGGWQRLAWVIAGRIPERQLLRPLAEVAKPIAPAPPPKLRPTWKAETVRSPAETLEGSTMVASWPTALAGSRSTAIRMTRGFGTAPLAAAVVPSTSNTTPMRLKAGSVRES